MVLLNLLFVGPFRSSVGDLASAQLSVGFVNRVDVPQAPGSVKGQWNGPSPRRRIPSRIWERVPVLIVSTKP